MAVQYVTRSLTEVECCECGLVFGVPANWDSARRETGKGFFCPNGHSLTYKGEIDRLRKKVQQLEATTTHLRDQVQATERSRAAVQGVLTKERKRTANGVCPCCKRSFQNVHRHIANQHPNFAKETTKS
jgi:hypothetical protein